MREKWERKGRRYGIWGWRENRWRRTALPFGAAAGYVKAAGVCLRLGRDLFSVDGVTAWEVATISGADLRRCYFHFRAYCEVKPDFTRFRRGLGFVRQRPPAWSGAGCGRRWQAEKSSTLGGSSGDSDDVSDDGDGVTWCRSGDGFLISCLYNRTSFLKRKETQCCLCDILLLMQHRVVYATPCCILLHFALKSHKMY